MGTGTGMRVERTGVWLTLLVCAERDSRKDEAVVFIFIFATAGLLVWAAVKPWVGKWVDVSSPPLFFVMGWGIWRLGTVADGLVLQSARERRSYIPVSTHGDG